MRKNDNLMETPSIYMSGNMPTLKLQDFKHLLAESKHIQNVYENTDFGGQKGIRQARRQINKLYREVDRYRKKYRKPCLAPYKNLTQQIKTVLAPIKDTSQYFKKQLDVYKKQRQENLVNYWKPIFDELCHKYNVPLFDIPQACLKMSLSRNKRIQAMQQAVSNQALQLKKKKSLNVKGYAIYPQTGEVVGKYANLKFVGTGDELKTLLDFAKKSNITLEEVSKK